MTAKVIGIGNSAGIVIPAALMSSLGLVKGDQVAILETSSGFEVRKAVKPPTFEELLENYYSKPFNDALIDFISEGDDVVIDWGEPRGEEEW